MSQAGELITLKRGEGRSGVEYGAGRGRSWHLFESASSPVLAFFLFFSFFQEKNRQVPRTRPSYRKYRRQPTANSNSDLHTMPRPTKRAHTSQLATQAKKEKLQKDHDSIQIFQMAYPNEIAVFAFDNSSGHACKAPDALVASRMNFHPGGKQPIMHDTILQNGTVQSMVFCYGDREWNSDVLIPDELLGNPKGIKRVLQERGL